MTVGWGHPHLIEKWNVPKSEQCEDIIVRCTISSRSDITAAGDIMCAAIRNPSNVRISSCVARYHHKVISPPQAISLRSICLRITCEAQYFPTFIKKSILKDSSWRAGAGMLAHIRAHASRARLRTLLYKICILYIIYRIKLSKYAISLHKCV